MKYKDFNSLPDNLSNMYDGIMDGSNSDRSKAGYVRLLNKLDEKGAKLLSVYVNAKTDILVDFNCSHQPKVVKGNGIISKNIGCIECGYSSMISKRKSNIKERLNEYVVHNGHNLLVGYVSQKEYIVVDIGCEHGPIELRAEHYMDGVRCGRCHYKNNSGKNNHLWTGGTESINKHFRAKISEWKRCALKNADYKCQITGESKCTLHVHHIKPFYMIVNDAHNVYGIKRHQNISDYTDAELHNISSYVDISHTNDIALVVKDSVHYELHSYCGGAMFETNNEKILEFKEKFYGNK